MEQRQPFIIVNQTEEEENAYDIVENRHLPKPQGVFGTVAHLTKSALGSGILGIHVAYMKAGYVLALPLNAFLGFYMAYCLQTVVMNGQILCRRTGRSKLSYPEIGEASLACCPSPKLAKYSKVFRYAIVVCVGLDLFGACATYQLIIAKTIKQLVENQLKASMEAQIPGYPNLKTYMAINILPLILICSIRHLKWLAPFSTVGNVFIAICMLTTVYYGVRFNPTFSGIKPFGTFVGLFEYFGMVMFSLSCCSAVCSVENNMKEPQKFPRALTMGFCSIVLFTCLTGMFGYAAFREASDAPITVNFPMELLPKILKAIIAMMMYITHGLNYWVPFDVYFQQMKYLHDPNKWVMWEYIYRAAGVVIIAIVAIIFPDIAALMGFLGAFAISSLAFVFPFFIEVLVKWYRPGLGMYRWRLIKAIVLTGLGIIFLSSATMVNIQSLYHAAKGPESNSTRLLG